MSSSSTIAPSGAIPLHERPAQDPAKIRELAHEFEGMLLVQMLRQMRQSIDFGTNDDEGLGLGHETMTDTVDTELARQLSLAGGIGIADVIVEAFEKQQALQADAAARTAQGRAAERLPVPLGAAVAPQPLARPAVHLPPARVPDETSRPVSGGGPRGVEPTTIERAGEATVPMPTDAPVTSKFGWRADPFNGRTRFHGGVDVRAAYGTAVPSAAAGRVVAAAEQGGYGLTVVVEHAPGLQTRYAHLSASLVREGDVVAVGQPIGRVGSSGRSTAPHLHFEVIRDGQRVDPEQAAARFRAAGVFKAEGASADSSLGGTPFAAAEE
jgi:murein DD-endopeptidase MepM/ murein hydrolase activator NlpD